MTCFIPSCKSNTSLKHHEKERISFHRMPTDITVKQRWYNLIPRAQVSWNQYSRICSKHFRKDCFIQEEDINNRRRLKTNAVPSLFLDCKSHDLISTQYDHLTPRTSSGKQERSKTNWKSASWKTDEGDSMRSRTDFKEQEHRSSSEDFGKENGCLQAGYYCNACSDVIKGHRYICIHCPDFDLCGACEAQGEHATHYMLRVPEVKSQVETMYVLETIREHLLNHENSVESSIVIESVKSEIKQEPDLLEMNKSDVYFSESWEKQLFNENDYAQVPKIERTEENESIPIMNSPNRTRFESETNSSNTKKHQYIPPKNISRSNYEGINNENPRKKTRYISTVQEICNTISLDAVNIVAGDVGVSTENIAWNCARAETENTRVISEAHNSYSDGSPLITATGMRESGNIRPWQQSRTPEKPCFLVLELSNSDTEKKIKINVKRVSPDKTLPWDQSCRPQP